MRPGLILMLGLLASGQDRPTTDGRPAEQRVVIPFDFESKFDDGRHGQIIGDMLWSKLDKRGGFVLPESMRDVRDWCQRNKTIPGPDTPLETMARIVRLEQGGDVGIWGKVERVEGFDTDVYDLSVRVADFSTDPPRMIYQKDERTRTVSEIPHVYLAEALHALDGKTPGKEAAEATAAAAAAPAKGENLVQGGDFQKGSAAPMGWDPLHDGVTWVQDGKDGRIIRFDQDEAVAGGTGVLYYSQFFPVEEGATYRFRCRWKSTGSAVKVFIKGYDVVPGTLGKERREVYRSQQNPQGPPNLWNEHVAEFTPRHVQFTPRWARVMLYAYWPAGTVEWDDVSIQRVSVPVSRGRGPGQ